MCQHHQSFSGGWKRAQFSIPTVQFVLSVPRSTGKNVAIESQLLKFSTPPPISSAPLSNYLGEKTQPPNPSSPATIVAAHSLHVLYILPISCPNITLLPIAWYLGEGGGGPVNFLVWLVFQRPVACLLGYICIEKSSTV